MISRPAKTQNQNPSQSRKNKEGRRKAKERERGNSWKTRIEMWKKGGEKIQKRCMLYLTSPEACADSASALEVKERKLSKKGKEPTKAKKAKGN